MSGKTSTNVRENSDKRPEKRRKAFFKNYLSDIEAGNILGPLLEAFVISEIHKQQTWSETDYSLYHYRDSDNKEADLVLELSDGKIIAIEIKTAGSFSIRQS